MMTTTELSATVSFARQNRGPRRSSGSVKADSKTVPSL